VRKGILSILVIVAYLASCAQHNSIVHDPVSAAITHLELPKTIPGELILEHTGYTLSYNTAYHIANWVTYELTETETVSVVKRNDDFEPDPLLHAGSASNKDYEGKGYDKGHLAPAADMCWSFQTMDESFYLSNMSPQLPAFNRGIWKKLETQVRNWAKEDKSVYITTGPILTEGLKTIGDDKITVPSCFFKVILDYTEPGIKGIGFIMPNEGSSLPLQHFAVSIDSVEKVTHIDFFYQLPDEQENLIESKLDLNQWSWTSTATHSEKK
jgi:endonuclease G, mitochondrial